MTNMKTSLALSLLALSLGVSDAAGHIVMGEKAPAVRVWDEAGNLFDLATLRGRKVVVCFFPTTNLPGSIALACNVRKRSEDLAKRNIEFVWVNYASPASHRAFKERFNLPFPFICDKDGEVAKAFGAKSKVLFKYTKNMSFLIDEEGTIVRIIDGSTIDKEHYVDQIINGFNS